MNGGEGGIKRGNINKERQASRAVSGMSGRRNVRAKRVPETRERKPVYTTVGNVPVPRGVSRRDQKIKKMLELSNLAIE